MSFLYSSSIQWAQFVLGYLPSSKPRLLEWAKSGGYVKAIKIFVMRRAQWDFLLFFFKKVAVTLPSFSTNQMLETPAQMVIFDAFFCPRNGICPSNSHLLSLFLWFSFLFPAVPLKYRYPGALWKHFFLICPSLKEKEGPLYCLLSLSWTTWYQVILWNYWQCWVLPQPWSHSKGGDPANVHIAPRPQDLWTAAFMCRADQTMVCCHHLLPVMLQDILSLREENSAFWTSSPFPCTFMLLVPLCHSPLPVLFALWCFAMRKSIVLLYLQAVLSFCGRWG